MHHFSSQPNHRSRLRRLMQLKRNGLTAAEQTQAAQSIIPQALSLIDNYHASTLAFYLPFNGEISPLPLIESLLRQGKKIALPILHPFSNGQLLFLRYHRQSDLKTNRFGIQEPLLDVRSVVPLNELEMIFTPLVACDHAGNRLGMGGGFYDRTLAQARNVISVGLAHRCQQVERLPVESWDMPLDHIILGASK